MSEQSPAGGMIFMAATPIGNVEDASPRLRALLESADIIAAEDTRRLRGLCSRLGVVPTGRIMAFHEHVEEDRAEALIDAARSGQTVLVVSDAGTPTVSDPGYKLTVRAVESDVRVAPLPGPSAALAALSVSGLPSDRFVFEGFLPRKGAELRERLEDLAGEPRTIILFESPRRTAETLRVLRKHLGCDRRAAMCRELTKTHEEVMRGTLEELVALTSEEPVLGEVTLVIAGGPQREVEDLDMLARRALTLADHDNLRLKEAAALVAEGTGARPNQVFRAALELH